MYTVYNNSFQSTYIIIYFKGGEVEGNSQWTNHFYRAYDTLEKL